MIDTTFRKRNEKLFMFISGEGRTFEDWFNHRRSDFGVSYSVNMTSMVSTKKKENTLKNTWRRLKKFSNFGEVQKETRVKNWSQRFSWIFPHHWFNRLISTLRHCSLMNSVVLPNDLTSITDKFNGNTQCCSVVINCFFMHKTKDMLIEWESISCSRSLSLTHQLLTMILRLFIQIIQKTFSRNDKCAEYILLIRRADF